MKKTAIAARHLGVDTVVGFTGSSIWQYVAMFPSHMVWQGLDPAAFILDFADRILHVDCKDTRMRMGNGRNGILGSHRPWADPRRGWDFVSTGRGDVPWEDALRALNAIGYDGPTSVEWEDAGMDRVEGAPAGLAFVRSLL